MPKPTLGALNLSGATCLSRPASRSRSTVALIRRPSINPRRPRFWRPMTLLNSPFQTSLMAPRSLSPISLLHSLPETLVVALSSSLSGCHVDTPVLIRRLFIAPVASSAEAVEMDCERPLTLPENVGSDVARGIFGFMLPSIPRPPPAAMAVALKTAAAFRESSSACNRSTTASSRPSTL